VHFLQDGVQVDSIRQGRAICYVYDIGQCIRDPDEVAFLGCVAEFAYLFL